MKKDDRPVQGSLFGDSNTEQIEGTLERVIWESNDGAFSVIRLRPEGRAGIISATIPCAPPLVGQDVVLTGVWTRHPKYGDQFKAHSVHVEAPTDARGIERFLASGAVKGTGPVNAHRIVEAFGKKALDVIEKHPSRLTEISGIGKKTAEKIHDSYMEQSELRDVMVWLEAHGVSGAYAARIYQKYSSFAMNVLEEHPYRLARDISGIGFQTADQVARAEGIGHDDRARISAGIDYALSKIALSGHCCIPEGVLTEKTSKMLEVDAADVDSVMRTDVKMGRLVSEDVGEGVLIYPPYLYHAEKYTAARLRELIGHAEPLGTADPEAVVLIWEENAGVELAENQRKAVVAAITEGVFVLTGGPGTGKTTVIRAMIDILEASGLSVMLGAPTGRAAKRLSESAGRKAMTIHRMLEAQGGTEQMSFQRNEDEPLEADVIILDEVSMMDIVLMQHFLEAVPDGAHLILVGDVDQLPAVGPGSVLKDILRSDAVPSVRLTEIFRQGEGSGIVMAAHRINSGLMPELPHIAAGRDIPQNQDFVFLEEADADTVEEEIVRLCRETLPQSGYDVMRDVQVLSPMHRLSAGVDHLNIRLQEVLNPPSPGKPEYKNSVMTFRLGDKVMQMKNDYQKGVFNGDIGFICEMDQSCVTVEFADECVAEYEASELGELSLAYAMSVHKSQGSEYPVVIMPLVRGHYMMLQRSLLYTAVTRAEERVLLLGEKKALAQAVSNDRTRRRYTLLAERLAGKL